MDNEKVLTNFEFFELAQATSPSFLSQTGKITKEQFDTKGFLEIANNNYKIISEFFELSLRIVLNQVRSTGAVDSLEKQGFSRSYTNPKGAILQRINVLPIKPVSPAFKNLQNFGSVDPFIIRKPKQTERFYRQNFDYQNFITIQDYELKQIFLSDTGVFDLLSGIMQNLDNGYVVQNYLNKLEALHSGISDSTDPLQTTQKITMSGWGTSPTDAQTREFLIDIKNVLSSIKVKPYTSAFNQMKFGFRENVDDLVLLIKPETINYINTNLLTTAYHNENLKLDTKVVEVENFGGITYTKTISGVETTMKPVYNQIGECVGFNASGSIEDDYYQIEELNIVDPHEDIIAILCNREIVFSSIQNPYVIKQIENPRGEYINYFANSKANGIWYDKSYTLVEFLKPSSSVKKKNNK